MVGKRAPLAFDLPHPSFSFLAATVIGRRERARGGGQAAARQGGRRPRLQGQIQSDVAFVGREERYEAVVKLLQSCGALSL